jgi:hypothetical protein
MRQPSSRWQGRHAARSTLLKQLSEPGRMESSLDTLYNTETGMHTKQAGASLWWHQASGSGQELRKASHFPVTQALLGCCSPRGAPRCFVTGNSHSGKHSTPREQLKDRSKFVPGCSLEADNQWKDRNWRCILNSGCWQKQQRDGFGASQRPERPGHNQSHPSSVQTPEQCVGTAGMLAAG